MTKERNRENELLERPDRLIPPQRMHRHRYHGVLAPNAKLRAAVVASGRSDVETSEPRASDPVPAHDASRDSPPARPANSARIRWAVRLARIYGVLPFPCVGSAAGKSSASSPRLLCPLAGSRNGHPT
jgi:hypothetical protein